MEYYYYCFCLFVCFFLKEKKMVKKCFQVTWRHASNSLVRNACRHCDIAGQDSSVCVRDETMRETMCKLWRDIAPVGGIQDHDVPKEVKAYQIQVAVECLVATSQTPIQGFSRG